LQISLLNQKTISCINPAN